MSTYQEQMATRPRAAAFDRWATRLTWMIVPSVLVAAFSLIGLTLEPITQLTTGLVYGLVWVFGSIMLTCALLAARLVLAALRDAELDS